MRKRKKPLNRSITIEGLFKRADYAMYECKKAMKAERKD